MITAKMYFSILWMEKIPSYVADPVKLGMFLANHWAQAFPEKY